MHQLYEATYALSDRQRLSKDNLLSTVLGWRMVELFKEKEKIKIEILKPGFSIRSNVPGSASKNTLVNELLDDDTLDKYKINHHKQGTHKINEIDRLSVSEHTLLHNEIRKLFKAKVSNNVKIDAIYKDFLKAYDQKLIDYDYFGNRLKSYEKALMQIAIEVHDLISDKTFIANLYKEALDKLKSEGKLESPPPNNNKQDILEEFKLYENLWIPEITLTEEKLIDLFWAGIKNYSSDIWFDSSTNEKEEILWQALEQLNEPIDKDRAIELFWDWADGLEEDSFIDFN